MKKKSTVKVTDVTSDQVKHVIKTLAKSKHGMIHHLGVRNYNVLRHPAVNKKAAVGDAYYVIAKIPHREDDKNMYHWEAEYIFDGKHWVCSQKHECPEPKAFIVSHSGKEKL